MVKNYAEEWLLKAIDKLKLTNEENTPCPELLGLTLDELVKMYPDNTTVQTIDDITCVEIVNSEGTILCQLRNDECVDARLFTHQDE